MCTFNAYRPRQNGQYTSTMAKVCLRLSPYVVKDRVPEIGFSGTGISQKWVFKASLTRLFFIFGTHFDDFSKFRNIFGTLVCSTLQNHQIFEEKSC